MRTVAGALSLLVLCHAASASLADEGRLRKDLFNGYDKAVRPENTTVIHFFGPTIQDVKVYDRDSVIKVFAFLELEWADPRLKWNKSDYAGISRMSIADGLLWAPDLAVFNPHTVEDIWGVNPQNLILHYSGTVKWVPPTMIRANCIPDLTMWPRDTHSCKLIIGSWKHTGNMLDLQIAGEPKLENSLDYNISVSSSLWEILEANTTREKMYFLGGDVPEFYVTIDVHLEVRRYAPSITSIVFVPALCLSLLTLFVFLLHPKSGEKINLGGVSVILDLIFLIFIVSLVGHSHATTPLLVKLALLQLVMATISVLASALVLRLTSNPRSTGIPTCFHRPLTLIAKCLFLGNYSEIVSQPAEKNSGDDFLVLAAATDRVLLLVFLAVCVSNIALFSSVM